MKAKVIKTFKDKVTKKVNYKGETIEVTEKRLKEINKQDAFVEEIKERAKG